MTIQMLIVVVLIAAAAVYGATLVFKKGRSFSTKKNCSDDCGCGGGSKKLPS